MAKDTEKLIRQLSLISFLMAERRPVSALEIKQDVEGYSQMNDEAFARRFYADRAELESLGIQLKVDKPAEGYYEAENYSLPPENFYLPSIKFTDRELGALRTALSLLDGEFAYAEPLRLALQQLSWGKPNPIDAPEQRSVALAVTAGAGGRDLSARLSKVETAIFRRKTILFDYYTIGRDAEEQAQGGPLPPALPRRAVLPDRLLARARGRARLPRLAHPRQGRLLLQGRARLQPPGGLRPARLRHAHGLAARRSGRPRRTIWLSDRIDWLALRHFGHAGEVARDRRRGRLRDRLRRPAPDGLVGARPRRAGAHRATRPSWSTRPRERIELVVERHSGDFELAAERRRAARRPTGGRGRATRRASRRSAPSASRAWSRSPGILIDAAREGRKLELTELRESLQVTEQELRQDIDVLNVVNFGGGSYVLYAEIQGDTIEVDPEPYGDNFARPARLLPLEAKALVAAIDLIGEHLPEGSLASARQKIVDALGQDPAAEGLQITTAKGDDSEIARACSTAIVGHRLLKIEYYKENEDEFTERTVEPYKLANGQEGWYLHCWDLDRDEPALVPARPHPRGRGARAGVRAARGRRARRARLARRPARCRPRRTARIWISPDRARWAREDRRVVEELRDGAVIVERTFASHQWLAREILKEAGDAVVLEPEDARQAVLDAAETLAGVVQR